MSARAPAMARLVPVVARLDPAIALSRVSRAITAEGQAGTPTSHAVTKVGVPILTPVPHTAATNPSVTS
jgi:hypothetical protein